MPPWKKATKSIPGPAVESPLPGVGAVKRLSRRKAAKGGADPDARRPAPPVGPQDPQAPGVRTPRLETLPTGFPEVDKVNRDLLDVRNELRLLRARLAEVETKTRPGVEYASRLADGRFDIEEFLGVDPATLPPRAGREVGEFLEEMRRAEAEGEYRTTRGLGRNLGRMI